ncbi:DUF7410 domain-containing protein [Halalkalicoccus tibetensis]|uniref:C2H2-type zinc finger protein n=1 Tax=Halalkalicoccus tibetensis TaxID=175632 RepID=A0ABD5V429_9EURY
MDRTVIDRPADGEDHTCPQCGRPFARAEYVTFHRGLEHPETLTEEDRTRFAEVYRAENDEIKRFRLKALAVLIGMYFTFLYLYLVLA